MKEKKSHGIQLLIRAVVRNPKGKIISDTGQNPAKSFLIAFLEFIWGICVGVHTYAEDTLNSSEIIYSAAWTMDTHFEIDAGINDDAHGIVIGTGDTTETNEDYKLETQLTEGTGAGNITHGAQVVGSAGVVGANVDLVLERPFTNATGSSIIVKEAGLYVLLSVNAFCIIRDVLAPAITVPNGCSLTVYYTIRTTV